MKTQSQKINDGYRPLQYALLWLLCLFTVGHAVSAEHPDTYPSRPVRIIVGFLPGGGSDFMARFVAKKLTEKLGQSFFVDNRPGAGGNVGAEIALTSANDGYTLLLAANSYSVNASLYSLPFNAAEDISPIAVLASGSLIIAVNPETGFKTLADVVTFAKNNPVKISFASACNGSVTHVATEQLMTAAGIEMLHVPYKGTSPALADAVSGQVQLILGEAGSTLPYIESGKLTALAVTTATRLDTLKDIPTVAEAGYPGFSVSVWHGLIGPQGMPAPIVDKLNRAIREVLNDSQTKAQFASMGLTPTPESPAAFAKLISDEVKRWGKLIKERHLASR